MQSTYSCNSECDLNCVFVCVSPPGRCEGWGGHGSQESGSAGEEAEEGEGGSGEEAAARAGPGAEEGGCTVSPTLFIPVCGRSHIHIISKSLCRSPPPGWKPRRSSRRRMRRRRGGITSGMSIWGRSSSSWWWTWTRSSSLGLAVSRRSRGPSPSTGTSWSRLLRPWGRQVSDIHRSHTHTVSVWQPLCSTSPCFLRRRCASSRLLSIKRFFGVSQPGRPRQRATK